MGLEYLINYPSLYPSLSGFVSNINWRQYALKRISCHQPNNMPYPKWLLHPPASSSSPISTGKTSYAVLSPPPCRAQGKLGLPGLREEVRRGWGTPSLVPTAMWSMGKPVPPPLSCQMAQGPVGRHHCSLLPILPPPLLCSPGYISHNTCAISNWGGHSFTLGTSPRTHDPSRDLRAKLESVLHLRGT